MSSSSSSRAFVNFGCYDPRLPNSYQHAKINHSSSSCDANRISGQRRDRDEEETSAEQPNPVTIVETKPMKLAPFSNIQITSTSSTTSSNRPHPISDGITIDTLNDTVVANTSSSTDSSSILGTKKGYTTNSAHHQARILFPAVVTFAQRFFGKNNENDEDDDEEKQVYNFTKSRLEMITDIAEALKNDPIAAASAKRGTVSSSSSSSSTTTTPAPFSAATLLNNNNNNSGQHQQQSNASLHLGPAHQKQPVVLPSKQEQEEAQFTLDEMRREEMIRTRTTKSTSSSSLGNNEQFLRYSGLAGRGMRLMLKMGYKEGEPLNEGGLTRPLRVQKGGALGENNNNNNTNSTTNSSSGNTINRGTGNLMMSNQLMFQ